MMTKTYILGRIQIIQTLKYNNSFKSAAAGPHTWLAHVLPPGGQMQSQLQRAAGGHIATRCGHFLLQLPPR
jgi:hypothetical protein